VWRYGKLIKKEPARGAELASPVKSTQFMSIKSEAVKEYFSSVNDNEDHIELKGEIK